VTVSEILFLLNFKMLCLLHACLGPSTFLLLALFIVMQNMVGIDTVCATSTSSVTLENVWTVGGIKME